MRHQPVAMPFEPVATQCGLPKSQETESRSLRSRTGVRANDRFHSLIPPAGQNKEETDLHVFLGLWRTRRERLAAPPSDVSIHSNCIRSPRCRISNGQGPVSGYLYRSVSQTSPSSAGGIAREMKSIRHRLDCDGGRLTMRTVSASTCASAAPSAQTSRLKNRPVSSHL